jgi:hypothetical protein
LRPSRGRCVNALVSFSLPSHRRGGIRDELVNESLGIAVATTGLLITAVGVVGVNVVFFRSLPRLMDRPVTDLVRSAVFEFVLWLLAWAAVGMIGISILLLGLVLSGGVVTWAPLAPLSLVVLMIALAWYSRWRLRQLRNS